MLSHHIVVNLEIGLAALKMSPCIRIADKPDALACKINLFVSGRASKNFFEILEVVLLVCVLNPVDFVKPAAVVNHVALRLC